MSNTSKQKTHNAIDSLQESTFNSCRSPATQVLEKCDNTNFGCSAWSRIASGRAKAQQSDRDILYYPLLIL